MNNKFKYYSNSNAFIFKIINESGSSKLNKWLSDLKKTLYITDKANNAPTDYA